jgi:ketosteroid isomerase-like protein
MSLRRWLPIALLLIGRAVVVQAQAPQDLTHQVFAAESSFAHSMAARDVQAFASFVAPEAVFMGRRALHGRDSIVAAWRPFFDGPQAPFSWNPEVVEVLASGTLALTSGPVRDPSGKQTGVFNSIWRRDPDGRWRVVFDKGCPVCSQQPSLVGSWKLVSAKSGGQLIEFPPGTTILKHVTPTHFVWVHYDRNGQITQAGGGSYVLDGTRYDETPEYGLGEGVQPLLGKRQSFTARVEGNRWYHGGQESNGAVIEEIWERM